MPTNEPTVHWLQRLLIGRRPGLTLVRACILGALTFLAFRFTVLPIRIQGGSMLPTYSDHSINFINLLAYLRHEPRRGDVVGIRFAGPHDMLLKRIVGLPGERVGFSGGKVTVNARKLDEPYLQFQSNWERDAVQLGPDEFFVVGDNRSMPMRDHTFGIARRERIIGKVML